MGSIGGTRCAVGTGGVAAAGSGGGGGTSGRSRASSTGPSCGMGCCSRPSGAGTTICAIGSTGCGRRTGPCTAGSGCTSWGASVASASPDSAAVVACRATVITGASVSGPSDSAAGSAGTVESTVDHGCAATYVGGVVVDDGAVTPSHSPVAPSPAPGSEGSDSDADGKTDRQSAPDYARRRNVVKAGIGHDGYAINHPRVIDGRVDEHWVCRCNHNDAGIAADVLLRSAAQLACGFGALAHHLHCGHDVLRLVVVSVPEVHGPLVAMVHLREDAGKGGERLDAGIPVLGICCGSNLVGCGIPLRLPPSVCVGRLARIG